MHWKGIYWMTINKGGHFYSKNLSAPKSLPKFLICVWGAWGSMSEGGSHTWSSLQMRKYNLYWLSFRLLYWWWGFRNGSRILKTFLSLFIRFHDKYLYLILKTNKKHLNCCPIRHSFGYLHDILLLKWTVPWWKVSDSWNGHKQMENHWVEGWGRTSKSKNQVYYQLNSLMDPSKTKSKVVRYYVSPGRIKCALGTNTHERSCQRANCESIINSKSHQAFRSNFRAIGNAQVYWHYRKCASLLTPQGRH